MCVQLIAISLNTHDVADISMRPTGLSVVVLDCMLVNKLTTGIEVVVNRKRSFVCLRLTLL